MSRLDADRPVLTGVVGRSGLAAALCLGMLALFSSGCLPDATPPRVAMVTAVASETDSPTPTPVYFPAATPTPGGAGAIEAADTDPTAAGAPTITLWINETSDEQREALQSLVDAFSDASGILVDPVLVAPDLLPALVQSAVISGTLPDLILHPVAYSQGWVERGILDPQSPSDVLSRLGPETFRTAVLDLVRLGDGSGQIAALPSDGWQQLIVYRADWFRERDLDPPTTFDALLAAAADIYEPDSLVSGLVVPTESDLVTTQQVFEHLAAANGCQLADGQGRVALLHPACLESLDFYRQLVNQYSPIGVQTDISALNAYLAGRTGIIITSPAALPALAGLDLSFRPSCQECAGGDYLAENSGIVTDLIGSGEFSVSANYAEVMALGVTSEADQQAAAEFLTFWFQDGYLDWLASRPERRIPMRRGTGAEPAQYASAWLEMPIPGHQQTLSDLFGPAIIGEMEATLLPTERWGYAEGQGVLVTDLYEDLILSPLLQEMLSGYFTSSQTIVEMYRTVVDLIPDYAFPLEIQESSEG